MPFLNDRVFDNGLSVLDTEANRFDICNADPDTFTEATVTFTLGNKTGLVVNAPEAGSPNGRMVTVPAFSGGSVTGTGTATHWAISDTVNSRILASGPLVASQGVTSGNTFSTPGSFTIRFAAPTT